MMTIEALESRLTRYALRCSPKAAGYVRDELQAVRAARLEIERLKTENAEILRRAVETAMYAGKLEKDAAFWADMCLYRATLACAMCRV